MKESVVTASNTATVTYSNELGVVPQQTAGANEANCRNTSRIFISGIKFKIGIFNNANQEVYVRIALVQLRDGLAASVASSNASLLGQYEPTATEKMEDYPYSAQNAQNFHSIMLPWDSESVKKVYYNKIIKLGPTGGTGAKSAVTLLSPFVKIGKYFKHELADGTGVINGRLVFVVCAVDPTNDTAAAQSVELTYHSIVTFQDSVN